MNEHERKVLDLTPLEQAQAEKRAYTAWLKTQEIYNPPPKPEGGDLVHENRRIMDTLVNIVGYLPALLGVILLASILVSLDKTAAAFEASVANSGWFFGAWVYVVALSAVIMTDAALVVAEFALVRDMLAKNLHRSVLTWPEIKRGWQVFTGSEQPRDWHEMPDQTLHFYSRFLFVLVLSANVFAVTKASNIRSASDLDFENALLLFTGIAGALSLRLVGRMAAHMVYELARKREGLLAVEMREQWRRDMADIWREEGAVLIAEALHAKFLRKNNLPLDAHSHYLIGSGDSEDGNFELVPFQASSEPIRSNGRQSE